jgi:hypothetical protein
MSTRWDFRLLILTLWDGHGHLVVTVLQSCQIRQFHWLEDTVISHIGLNHPSHRYQKI